MDHQQVSALLQADERRHVSLFTELGIMQVTERSLERHYRSMVDFLY